MDNSKPPFEIKTLSVKYIQSNYSFSTFIDLIKTQSFLQSVEKFFLLDPKLVSTVFLIACFKNNVFSGLCFPMEYEIYSQCVYMIENKAFDEEIFDFEKRFGVWKRLDAETMIRDLEASSDPGSEEKIKFLKRTIRPSERSVLEINCLNFGTKYTVFQRAFWDAVSAQQLN